MEETGKCRHYTNERSGEPEEKNVGGGNAADATLYKTSQCPAKCETSYF